MTRLRRIEKSNRIFFVTTNIARGARVLTPAERDLILNILDLQRGRGEFLLFGFAVMETHAHLLISPESRDLVRAMGNFKSRTGFEIARLRGVHGPLWQERYFDAIVRRVRDFWQKLEYIHRNPVEAGSVENAEQWHWSSYRHYLNRGTAAISVDHIELPFDEQELLWPAPWR